MEDGGVICTVLCVVFNFFNAGFTASLSKLELLLEDDDDDEEESEEDEEELLELQDSIGLFVDLTLTF